MSKENEQPQEIVKLTKADVLQTISEMRKNIEDLPPHAMVMPLTHYDLLSLLILLSGVLKAED
jgi:hypothetical protein